MLQYNDNDTRATYYTKPLHRHHHVSIHCIIHSVADGWTVLRQMCCRVWQAVSAVNMCEAAEGTCRTMSSVSVELSAPYPFKATDQPKVQTSYICAHGSHIDRKSSMYPIVFRTEFRNWKLFFDSEIERLVHTWDKSNWENQCVSGQSTNHQAISCRLFSTLCVIITQWCILSVVSTQRQ